MTTLIIIGVAIVIIGAYIRWAVRPALASYRLGVAMGQRQPQSSPVAVGRNSDTGPQLAVTWS